MTLPEVGSLVSAGLPPAERAFGMKGFRVLAVVGLAAAEGHEDQDQRAARNPHRVCLNDPLTKT